MAAVRTRVATLFAVVGLLFLTATPAWAQRTRANNNSQPREPQFSETKVLKLLQGKDDERSQGLAQLDQKADEAITVKLLKKTLDKDARLSGAVRDSTSDMMQRFGKIQRSEVLPALASWLKAPNYRFAAIAAEILGQRGDTAAIAELLKVAPEKNFREVFGFRKTLVDAVLALKDPAAVDFAVKLLPLAEGIVRYDLLRYLITVTDQDFGNDQASWSTWWADNQRDFQFSSAASSYDPKQNTDVSIDGLATPSFYGVKIYAKRIVFVIDTSSSMVQDGPRPPHTRMETAQRELTATINALPDDAYFTILSFNNGVTAWGKVVQASLESRAAAVKWVDGLKHGRGTNSHAGLMKAFAIDGNIEAIVFLSDGQPSAGVTDVQKILTDVAQENLVRKISIYSIGIFTGVALNQDLSGFMSELARQNRGVYRQIN